MFLDYNGWIFLSVLIASTMTCFIGFKFVTSLYKAESKTYGFRLMLYSILAGSSLFLCCLTFKGTLDELHAHPSQLSLTYNGMALLCCWLIGYSILHTAQKKVLPLKSLLSAAGIISLASLVTYYCMIQSFGQDDIQILVMPSILATLITFSISMLMIITMYWLKTYDGVHHNKIKLFFAALMAIGYLAIEIAFSSGVYTLQEVLDQPHPKYITMLLAMLLVFAFLTGFIILIFYDRLTQSIDKEITFVNSFPVHNQFESYDALTKLPNRSALNEHLTMAAKKCDRTGDSMALAYIDLDHFKPVNDYFGHHVGDLLLIEVAERFTAALRSCDYIARTGGDEFVAILGEIDSHESVVPVIQRLIDAVKEPFYIEGHLIEISCSVGIAIYPRDGNLEKLKVSADTAMYKAKENGRNQYRFYDAEIEQASDEMKQIRLELIQAINENQFTLHYQPKFYTKNQAPAGAEALLRWHHPKRGLLTPIYFIEAAERFGFVEKINNIVLIEACKTIHEARQSGFNLNISVNLSRQQFRNPHLVEYIRAVMDQYDIEPESLTFEISETHAIHNQNQFKKLLAKFKFAKLKISIDDFGLHPFSLTYLKNLEVSEVKLDKSFLADIGTDPSSLAIVDAVVRLAHALRLNVVAEGIENQSQLHALGSTNCDQMQGYFFSKPLNKFDLFKLYQHLYHIYQSNEAYAANQQLNIIPIHHSST